MKKNLGKTKSESNRQLKSIILASTSPRRRELMKKLGVPFSIEDSYFEEDMTQDIEPMDLAQTLSMGKAQAVAQKHQGALVIGCDTIVCFDGKVFGKPKNEEEARVTLKIFSGKIISIITGYSVVDTDSRKFVSGAVESKICLKRFTDETISEYIKTGEALDKAGSFGVQGSGAMLVDHTEGDYDNILGLPLTKLVESLKDFGVDLHKALSD